MDPDIAMHAKAGCAAVRSYLKIELELGVAPQELPGENITLSKREVCAMLLVCEAALGTDYSEMTLDQALRFQATMQRIESRREGGQS